MAFEFAPKYVKIMEDIRSKINNGHFKPGERCMSESEIKAHYGVSDTTAKKAVYELVHEGYLYREHGKGTFVAQQLAKSSANNVLFLIPDIRSSIYPPIARGVEDILRENDYTPILCCSDSDIEKEKKFLRMFLDDDVAGMVIVPRVFPIQEQDVLLAARKKGFVVINRHIDSWHGDSVLSDDFNGAQLAVKHLIDAGRSRIVQLLLPQAHSEAAIARTKGYAKALEDAGIEYDPDLCFEITKGAEEAREVMDKIIAAKIPFDAIFAQSDFIAFWAYKSLREAEINVPEDVSLVGYGDIDAASTFYPALTTVRQPFYEMGRKAGELLIAQLNNGDGKAVEGLSLLPTELIIRDSSI